MVAAIAHQVNVYVSLVANTQAIQFKISGQSNGPVIGYQTMH